LFDHFVDAYELGDAGLRNPKTGAYAPAKVRNGSFSDFEPRLSHVR